MIERARALIALKRFDEAAELIERLLADFPDDPLALGYLAICRSEAGRHEEATGLAGRAVAASPDDAWCHNVLAQTFFRRHRLKEAEEAVLRAIELDPQNTEPFALLGGVHLQQREWQKALVAARNGRRFDPDHVACCNIEAMALTQLGRTDEAAESMKGALRRSPTDARTHANQGWTLLHQGKYDKALEHFSEALRLDPTLDWAREGIKEALKAHNPIYRVLLRYKLFMNRLRDRWQFAIILGGYVLYRIALALAGSSPALAPISWVVVFLYVAFVILTWFGDPIFNLLLRLNRFGRHALSSTEHLESSVICSLLLAGGICGIRRVAGGGELWLMAAIGLPFLCASLRCVFLLGEPRARKGMLAYTAGVLLLGVYSTVTIWRVEHGSVEPHPLFAEIRALEEESERYDDARLELLRRLSEQEEIGTALLEGLSGVRPDDRPAGEAGESAGLEVRRQLEALLAGDCSPEQRSIIEQTLELSAWRSNLEERMTDAKRRTTSPEFQEKSRRRLDTIQRAGTAFMVYAILCVFVSQFVAVWLKRRYERL